MNKKVFSTISIILLGISMLASLQWIVYGMQSYSRVLMYGPMNMYIVISGIYISSLHSKLKEYEKGEK